MSAENDLALAYHMGYDDALAKRKPDASKAQVLASYDLATENAKLRELVRDYDRCTMHADCARCEYDGKLSTHCPLSPCFPNADELRELGVGVDG